MQEQPNQPHPPATDAPNAALYALDWQEINAPIPFNNREVIHTLRRPLDSTTIGNQAGVNESAKFRALIKAEEIVSGNVTQPKRDDSEAYKFLWNRCILRMTGYDGEGIETPLTDENRKDCQARHREIAVDAFTQYRTDILPEKTQETFRGGVYCVRVWQGRRKADDTFVGDFYVNFWSEAQRSNYKGAIAGRSERRGKDVVNTYEVPIFETAKLYDALIERIDGAGVTDGDTVRPATKAELVAHTQIFLKEAVMAELFLHWEKIVGN